MKRQKLTLQEWAFLTAGIAFIIFCGIMHTITTGR